MTEIPAGQRYRIIPLGTTGTSVAVAHNFQGQLEVRVEGSAATFMVEVGPDEIHIGETT